MGAKVIVCVVVVAMVAGREKDGWCQQGIAHDC